MALADKKPKKQKSTSTRRERKADAMYKANPTWAAEDDYRPKKMKTGGAKKPLMKAQMGAQVGEENKGTTTVKKNILGRTVKTTPTVGNYPSAVSKSVRKEVYDRKGNFVKQKTKVTSTDKNTGDSVNYKVTSKSQGENMQPKTKVRKALMPVRKKGGTSKVSKTANLKTK